MELKATELRIGNYLDETGDIVKVGFRTFEYYNDPEMEKIMRETIKPIPLTEEWLVKFGFDVFQDLSDDNIMYVKDGFYVNDLFQPEDCGFPIAKKAIGFVHQLQNIYFALTGEELTVK